MKKIIVVLYTKTKLAEIVTILKKQKVNESSFLFSTGLAPASAYNDAIASTFSIEQRKKSSLYNGENIDYAHMLSHGILPHIKDAETIVILLDKKDYDFVDFVTIEYGIRAEIPKEKQAGTIFVIDLKRNKITQVAV